MAEDVKLLDQREKKSTKLLFFTAIAIDSTIIYGCSPNPNSHWGIQKEPSDTRHCRELHYKRGNPSLGKLSLL